MLRTLLVISLIFSLSIFPGMRFTYATCGSCGVSAPGEEGAGHSHSSGVSAPTEGESGHTRSRGGDRAADAAIFGLMFGALMAAKTQEEAVSEDEKLDKLARELALAFKTIDPTEKHSKKKE